MHQNVSLGSNGVDRVCSLRKNPTRHPGTNFGTCSARFAPSFVRQPSGLECTQIVLNHHNISLGSNGVDRVRSLEKIPTRLHGTNFCTSSARFAPSFVRQPNDAECTQIVRNAPKRQFRVQWVDRVRSLRTILMRLHGTTFCTSSARCAPSFVRQPKSPECIKIVKNAPKCQFRVQWGASGAFVAKNSYATSWHKLLHYFGPFCIEFRMANKRSRMHPNSTKRTKTLV